MSIVAYGEPVYERLIGSECFYCYKPVYPPAVMWMGASAEIVLHSPCFMELSLRMGRDVLEIEQKTGRYFAANEVHDLRTRLVASEMFSGEARP